MKKILILNDVPIADSIGGQATFIKNLHPYLSCEYNCVYYNLPIRFRNQNVVPHRLLYALFVLLVLFRRKEKFNLILSHTPEASFIATFFATPLVHIFHGNNNAVATSKFWYGKFFRGVFRLFDKRITKKAVKLFTVGETRGNAQKMWNPIIKEVSGSNLIRKNLIFAGRFELVKNINMIIDAYANLPVEILNEHDLILIGTGTLKNSLEERAHKLNLNNKIKFLGQLDNSLVIKELSNSVLLVMASQYEGFPMIIAESLTYGVPVISTPVGDIPTVIKDNYNGHLINYKNYIQEFPDAVGKILNNIKLYSLNAQKSSSIFNAEQVSEELIKEIKKYAL